MERTMIGHVVEALEDTCDAMLGFRPRRAGEATIVTEEGPPHEVSAVVGLTGQVQGAIAVGMTMATAAELARRFLGSEDEPARSDVLDCAGEIVNILAGAVKGALGRGEVALGLPQILFGTVSLHCSEKSPCALVPFETEWGPIQLEFSLREAT